MSSNSCLPNDTFCFCTFWIYYRNAVKIEQILGYKLEMFKI